MGTKITEWVDEPQIGAYGVNTIPYGPARLNHVPRDCLHNHQHSPPRYRYVGMCTTAPNHHLWVCVERSAGSKHGMKLIPFMPEVLTINAIGVGIRQKIKDVCWYQGCPSNAVVSNKSRTKAYCDMHTDQASGAPVPCPATSILPCSERMNTGRECPTCRSLGV